MGAGVDKGREAVANSKQVEGVSGGELIWREPKVAGDCDDVEETCIGF